MRINKVLLLLAAGLVAFAIFFQWQIADHTRKNFVLESQYLIALEDHQEHNFFYTPRTTIQWVVNRQNPSGYFVDNPDMLFEPSQLNDSTLRATRYAISTLSDLDGMVTINRMAVGEFILGLYEADIKSKSVPVYSKYESGTQYAGFKTLPGKVAGVRPTMDALITLDALGFLDDPRLDLERVWNFITAHQNPDGGFWDEHYPKQGMNSSLKCTSFAGRALEILHRHMQRPFPEELSEGIKQFVSASHDPKTGGYSGQPHKPVKDSYNAFRAFISIWNTTNGSDAAKFEAVKNTINLSRLVDCILQQYYLPEQGAFCRNNISGKKEPSIKATHLIIWLLQDMKLLDRVDIDQLSRYVISLRTSGGQYGGDIYTTYSAIGLLQKMGIPTRPRPEPKKPNKPANIPSYVPAIFVIAALVTLLLGFQEKRLELEEINKALSKQANFDGLTGIYNRQIFDTIIKQEMEKATRYQRPLALIMFDIDDFKQVNDNFGHLAGDLVLKEITQLVKVALRDSDIFARWGGEEFIILAPETTLDGAEQLAEKLREMVSAKTFSVGKEITVSFGVSDLQKADIMVSLVNRTDSAMLEAKRLGKNRIRTSGSPSEKPFES